MTIPTNGYLDSSDVFAFAKLRFPANFSGSTPDTSFIGALYMAGDIVNSNADVWLGETRSGLSGGRQWPRQLDGGGDAAPFLTATVPDQLLRGYEWLVIAVALSPEDFGTFSESSATTAVTTGGLKKAQWDNLIVENYPPTTRRAVSTSTSDVPVHLQFHFDQAKFFLEQLVRPGAQLKLPGVPEPERPTPKDKGYHTLADFCAG